MRLLIALGLTLLVGATWAQHSSCKYGIEENLSPSKYSTQIISKTIFAIFWAVFNIESATDLLALPSDQLIDSDIEHEAVETIVDTSNTFQNSNEPLATVFDLPFGARLPGYERIQYAYGYQIPEKSKAQAAQSVSFPANVLLTHTPAETRKEVISSSPLHEDSTTLESTASTTEVVVVTQAPNHSSPKTSIPKDQTISWLNSTYFPQLLNLNLSPPENEHEFTAKLTEQSPESYHPPEAKLKTETALPSLQTGYLPPERDFLIESPQAPPLPPADSYLPPNLGTVSNVSESKSEGLTLKSGHLLDTAEHKSDSALLETSYLPPKPDPVSKIEKHELDFPLPESSYLPPNPDPILEFEDKSEPPLPDISYLPPNTDLVAKITESVTKPPQTKISNNDEPLILIPILSPPMKPAEEFEIQRNEGLTVLPLNAAPAGVIGEYENQPVTFSSDRKIPTPAGVVGEYENQPVKFSSDRKIPTPAGVVGEYENQPITFSSDRKIPTPAGVVGEYENQPITFSSDRKIPTPAGVVGEYENQPITFSSDRKIPTPAGVVGEYENQPITFSSDRKIPTPAGVVGEYENQPISFSSDRKIPTPAGVVGEYENQPITFSSDRKIPTPAGVVGEYENQPITFSSDRKIPTPAGVVGEYENQPITFSSDRKIPTPAGVVGEIEEGPIKFSAERKNSPPTGAILELEDSPITFSREIKHTPPVGVIEEYENLPIKFSSETESPVPYAITGEVKPGKIKPVRKPVDISPYAVVPETRDAVIRAHAKPPTARPVGVISEITENAIEAHSYQQPVVVAAIPKDNAACTQNHECSEEEICMDGMCINACIIAIGLCIGNAVCHARRHIPGCVCPDMFTAVTIRGSEQDQYDCMPMMMMMMGGSRSNRIAQGWATSGQRYPRPLASQNVNAFSLPPIGILTERGVSQGRITTSNIRQSSFSGDPCSPSPCGPNTRCEVSQRGIPLCRCLSDFVPDGNTINGCKPQCTVDDDCPDDYRCRATKCVRVCVQGACGTNAECEARNHRPVCECPSNYRGDPHITCTRERPEVKVAPPAPPLDPCAPNPCGLNADCRTRGDRPVCTCPLGYEGDPLSNCRRGECIENNDCPGHRVCQRLRCIDPCQEGICGSGAECTVRNHQPICSCPRGFTGDPFVTCRRFDPQELCSPSPCGRNTNCKVRNERAVCSCIDNYIGNPLTECRPECVTDSECPHNLACRNNICVNPCREACGEGAYCDVRNNRAVCSCPEFYQGDPYSRCFAECTAHDDCPGYQACFQLRCVDPCEGACGSSANCKVENHKPICSCPKGYTGHPFESCRPFTREDLCNPNPCGTQADCTPGFDSSGNDRPVCTCPVGFIGNPLISCERGDCQDHSQCRDQEACYAYTCQNPCYTDVGSVCGENAQCNVKNHQPVCSCPPGYDGNPLTECRIGRGGSFVAGRIRK
ncbi:uncharacterized protein [Macrobrachium rosenbergii]|uniref:uncharacterized protein n=1 Tax=Macrobrachium rosenbergii TaxID=79674 RepID=UPI0034D40357